MCARVRPSSTWPSRPSPPRTSVTMPAPTPAPASRMPRRRSRWLGAALALVRPGCGSSSLDSAPHAAPPAPPATRPAQSAAPGGPDSRADPGPTRARGCASSAARVPARGARARPSQRCPSRVGHRVPATSASSARDSVDRNGCDTRNDVLRRDLTAYVVRGGREGAWCSGTLPRDTYAHTTIAFLHGQSTSSRCSRPRRRALRRLAEGAQQLSYERRTAFANEESPPTSARVTAERGHLAPAAAHLPCAYVARQVAVKLSATCSGSRRPSARPSPRSSGPAPARRCPWRGRIPLGGGRVESAPAPAATTSAPGAGCASRQGTTNPRFDTCRAAKAAGYGPYASGQDPEYEW